MTFHSTGLFSGNGASGEATLDAVYLSSIVAIVATLLCSAAFHQRVGRILAKKPAEVLVPFGVTIATLLMLLAGASNPVGIAFILLTGIASGLFSGLQLVLFGSALSRLQTRSLVSSVAIGQIVASFLFALSILFPAFEAALFAASMPCLAALLLHFGVKEKGPQELNDVVPLDRQYAPDGVEMKATKRLVTRVCACVALVGFANEAARTLYMQIEESVKQLDAFIQTQAFVAFLVSAGVILIAIAAVGSKAKSAPKICYHVLGAGLTAGVLLLPAALVYPNLDPRIPLTVNTSFYNCFGMFMWLVIASLCRQHSSLCVRIVALTRGMWAMGPLIGLLTARLSMQLFGVSLESTFLIMVAGVIAVFTAANAVFDSSVLLQALDIIPSERRQRFQEKCRAVVERYGLTEREGEVMTLFAKGRNLDYIKDELCLSKSTVSTHRQHIYQKLGVHSLQEMLDLIQDTNGRR